MTQVKMKMGKKVKMSKEKQKMSKTRAPHH